jgi:hypothetical protein
MAGKKSAVSTVVIVGAFLPPEPATQRTRHGEFGRRSERRGDGEWLTILRKSSRAGTTVVAGLKRAL